MKFKEHLKTIFLDSYSEVLEDEERVNIVLSPSLYWVKKLELPVKYLYEVKKLIPSLFEDTLPEGNYSYTAYKHGDVFFLFAYEDKVILDLLSEKNISLSNVQNIHFAQNELQNIENSVQINESQIVCIRDELVIVLPSSWVKETTQLDFKNIQLSKNTIKLAQFGHIVDTKSIYTIGVILSIFILLLSVEWFISSKKIQHVNQTTEELFSKYKLKSTMFQNKALMKKYTGIHKRQEKLRKNIAYILAVKLSSAYSLTFLNIKNKVLTANFHIKNKVDKDKIIATLKSKGAVFKSSFKNDNLVVEIKL